MTTEEEELAELLAECQDGAHCDWCHDPIEYPSVDNLVWQQYAGNWDGPPECETELVCIACQQVFD